ncbi:hypothetical protein B484DRAFT_457784 [Ochromonadaceae sp. CCMP2298]|nr:hypothetical protein B484DRAFT_457784 [Ochromonadaceae sp. CCMP2298]
MTVKQQSKRGAAAQHGLRSLLHPVLLHGLAQLLDLPRALPLYDVKVAPCRSGQRKGGFWHFYLQAYRLCRDRPVDEKPAQNSTHHRQRIHLLATHVLSLVITFAALLIFAGVVVLLLWFDIALPSVSSSVYVGTCAEVQLSSRNVRLGAKKDAQAGGVSLLLHFDLRVAVAGLDVRCKGVRVALRCKGVRLALRTALQEACAILRTLEIPASCGGTGNRMREICASIFSAVAVDVEELRVLQTPESIPASLYIFAKDLGMDVVGILMQGRLSSDPSRIEVGARSRSNTSAHRREDTQALAQVPETCHRRGPRARSAPKRDVSPTIRPRPVMGGIPSDCPVTLKSCAAPVPLIVSIQRAAITLPHNGRRITAELRGLRCVSQCWERCEPSRAKSAASQENEGASVRTGLARAQGSVDRAPAFSSGPATLSLQSFSLFSSGNLEEGEKHQLLSSRPGSGFRSRWAYGRHGGLHARHLQLL